MKKYNWLFSALIILGIFIIPFTSYAAVDSDKEVYGDQSLGIIEPYVPTAFELQLKKEKIKNLNKRFDEAKLINDLNELRYDPDAPYFSIWVPVFQQQNSYYCGPATVKQTVDYINGSSNDQNYYAGRLGTTQAGTVMTNIAPLLRELTGDPYIYDNFYSRADWLQKVMYAIDRSRPPILDIRVTSIGAFPYTTMGHYLNVSGYDLRTGGKVRLADPHTVFFGVRWYNYVDVYNANYAHPRQALIW